MAGHVEGIFIAPAAKATLAPVESVSAVQDRGLEGDRYFDGAGAFSRFEGSGRALTLIAAEAIEAALAETGLDLSGGRSRRNVVTRGVALEELNGRKFRIGGALLRGVRLCAPCAYLEKVTEPGVFEALKGRGGLRADILESGTIRVGDTVEPA